MWKAFTAGPAVALAALALAAGCESSVKRVSAERYWRIKRTSVAPVDEHVDPRTGEIVGNYWMGRLKRTAFRVSKEEVDAFREANPRIVKEAEAHARGVEDGRRAGRRMYDPGVLVQMRIPYREVDLASIYKAAWQLARQYGFEDAKAFPHQR